MRMAGKLNFAAVDLGAENGRVMLGRFDGARLYLEEAHRFPNVPVQAVDTLYWDVLRLWGDIQQGLAVCARLTDGSVVSVGVDTWGVDFGLLGRDDQLLGNPVHYRDRRTEGLMAEAFQQAPRETIFERTGIQFLPFNTLYQLLALKMQGSPQLEVAERLLTMPDLLHFWLSGVKANEFTNATTTQCYDPRAGDWAWALLEQLDLPGRLFGAIVPPGTVLGSTRPALAAGLGLSGTQVIAPASHDTGSAVAGAPLSGANAIYLSSGTWSLMGVEMTQPVINERALSHNFTNEGGVGGTYRLLRNIMGLWLLQECRRAWASQGDEHPYAELVTLAAQAPAFGPLVNVGDARWLAPGDMPARIAAYCQETGQVAPDSKGAVVRCIFESLALEYRWVAERLEELTSRALSTIHVIGGGARNLLLNQFTADATSRQVIAGPVEATALGNVLVQALAGGHISSLAEGRDLVRRSFPVETYEPRPSDLWEAAYHRYLRLKA
jgi:rhamnulokinase